MFAQPNSASQPMNPSANDGHRSLGASLRAVLFWFPAVLIALSVVSAPEEQRGERVLGGAALAAAWGVAAAGAEPMCWLTCWRVASCPWPSRAR